MFRTTGLLVAGGRSARMHGKDKRVQEVNGLPAIVAAHQVLAEVCTGVTWLVDAAFREQALALQNQHQLVAGIQVDPVVQPGPLYAVSHAVTNGNICTDRVLVVLAVDVPGVASATLAQLLDRMAHVPVDAVVPWDGSNLHTLSAVYRAGLFRSSKITADMGFKHFLHEPGLRITRVDEETLPGSFANYNTQVEWDTWSETTNG